MAARRCIMTKTSELVWLYVKRRPFVKDMLKYDLVNYSKLARKICREAFGSQANFYAVKAALTRMGPKIRRKEEELERNVLSVLRNTSINIKNKIVVIVSSRPLEIDAISVFKARNFSTYITEKSEAAKVIRAGGIISVEENLNLFMLSSSAEIESTPGVISTLLHTLAADGINVREFISSYTDTMLVIKEADTSRAYELLSALTK